MLTTKDIKLLTSLLATKEDVEELKTEVGGLRETLQRLVISIG